MIKGLTWTTRKDEVTHSDPEGLLWAYYIYNEEDHFVLRLINDAGETQANLNSQHSTIEEAKNAAQKHFETTLKKHITP